MRTKMIIVLASCFGLIACGAQSPKAKIIASCQDAGASTEECQCVANETVDRLSRDQLDLLADMLDQANNGDGDLDGLAGRLSLEDMSTLAQLGGHLVQECGFSIS